MIHQQNIYLCYNENKDNPALGNILALLRIILVIPVQAATLERGFSLMKRTKSDWRNKLSPKTLSELMMIKLNGPDMDTFDPEPAIMKWWQEGPRSRRLVPYRHQPEIFYANFLHCCCTSIAVKDIRPSLKTCYSFVWSWFTYC